MRSAYGVEDFPIDGGPEWAASRRFDILAIAPDAPAADVPQMLRTLVSDRTGLGGLHDFELAFDTTDLVERAARSGQLPPGVAGVPSDNPPLATAIQEQLGLKLERHQSAVDVVVIDAAAMPLSD